MCATLGISGVLGGKGCGCFSCLPSRPAPTEILAGPLLSPGTALWSCFFPGLLGVRGRCAGAEAGSLGL